jgi:ATP-dependent DNA helicase RecQ
MGIDKPDVRLVIHYEPPLNPESYFQEAGRAGRDEKKSFAVCLYDKSDITALQEKVLLQFPSEQEIKVVYHALSGYTQVAIGSGLGISFDFDLQQFCKRYDLQQIPTLHALKTLELEGYISLSEAVLVPSRLMILVNKEQLYRFQVQNPRAEPFINALLRLYGGIFDHYTVVHERDMACYLNTSSLVVEKALRALHQRNFIDYIPATDKPQITYTSPRRDTQELHIDTFLLRKRKESFQQRIDAMIRYLETKWKCRSQMLLQYFGEEHATRCGICDVCLRRHELDVSDIEFEKVVGAIKRILAEHPTTITHLVDLLPSIPEDKIASATRWLIDSKLVHEDDNGILHWVS